MFQCVDNKNIQCTIKKKRKNLDICKTSSGRSPLLDTNSKCVKSVFMHDDPKENAHIYNKVNVNNIQTRLAKLPY